MIESIYEEVIGQTVEHIIYWYRELLDLEEFYDAENIMSDRAYGFISAPREMNIGKEVAGFYPISMKLDVFYEFSLPYSVEISVETSKRLAKLHHALSAINSKITPTANAPVLVPDKRFTTRQTQLTAPPHDWVTTIVGSATLNTWIQRNARGEHVTFVTC